MCYRGHNCNKTYLVTQLMKSINEGPDEEVGGEEASEDDEKDKVQVHGQSGLLHWLIFHLQTSTQQFSSVTVFVPPTVL